jgi:hypothetical protein
LEELQWNTALKLATFMWTIYALAIKK